MPVSRRFARAASLLLALTAACGGGDTTGVNKGVVQIASFVLTPQYVTCAFTINPVRIIGAPDSLLMQVQIVNTTPDTITLSTAGVTGQIIQASDPADVGKLALNSPSQPFTPKPAIFRSLDGDVKVRVMFATDPICQTKPVGYKGSQDIYITGRMRTTSGEYVTTPIRITVDWL